MRDILEALGFALFAASAGLDLGWRLVPNALPLAIAGTGLAARVAEGTLAEGVLAALAVFAAAFLCWRRGWLGGADTKLFGAGALLVPPGQAAPFVLCTALAGGLLASGYWALGRVVGSPGPRRPAGLLARLARAERWRLRRGGPLPYVLALAAGAGFVLVRS